MRRRIRKGTVFTILTDVSFQIIFSLLLLVQSYSTAWQAEAKKAADGKTKNDGLKAKLGDTRVKYKRALGDIENSGGKILDLKDLVGEQGEHIGELTEQLARLQPGGPVDIMVMADCSASMQPHLERLRHALTALFDWTPRLASECRIGVLGFRRGVVYRYPLTRIEPVSKDGGQSQRDLLAFMGTLETESSPTDHLPVFKEGLSKLPLVKDGRKQVALIIGDVSTSELDKDIVRFSQAEREQARVIVSGVRKWASIGDRVVGSIYVGTETDEPTSLNRRWFEDLAYPQGQNFSSDSAELFHVILRAIEPAGPSQ